MRSNPTESDGTIDNKEVLDKRAAQWIPPPDFGICKNTAHNDFKVILASSNRFLSLLWASRFDQLWILCLAGNDLYDISALSSYPMLGVLCLRENPRLLIDKGQALLDIQNVEVLEFSIGARCSPSGTMACRSDVVVALPNVWVIDGLYVHHAERQAFVDGNVPEDCDLVSARPVCQQGKDVLLKLLDLEDQYRKFGHHGIGVSVSDMAKLRCLFDLHDYKSKCGLASGSKGCNACFSGISSCAHECGTIDLEKIYKQPLSAKILLLVVLAARLLGWLDSSGVLSHLLQAILRNCDNQAVALVQHLNRMQPYTVCGLSLAIWQNVAESCAFSNGKVFSRQEGERWLPGELNLGEHILCAMLAGMKDWSYLPVSKHLSTSSSVDTLARLAGVDPSHKGIEVTEVGGIYEVVAGEQLVKYLFLREAHALPQSYIANWRTTFQNRAEAKSVAWALLTVLIGTGIMAPLTALPSFPLLELLNFTGVPLVSLQLALRPVPSDQVPALHGLSDFVPGSTGRPKSAGQRPKSGNRMKGLPMDGSRPVIKLGDSVLIATYPMPNAVGALSLNSNVKKDPHVWWSRVTSLKLPSVQLANGEVPKEVVLPGTKPESEPSREATRQSRLDRDAPNPVVIVAGCPEPIELHWNILGHWQGQFFAGDTLMASIAVEPKLGGRGGEDASGCWDVSILHEIYDLSCDPGPSEEESQDVYGGPAVVGQISANIPIQYRALAPWWPAKDRDRLVSALRHPTSLKKYLKEMILSRKEYLQKRQNDMEDAIRMEQEEKERKWFREKYGYEIDEFSPRSRFSVCSSPRRPQSAACLRSPQLLQEEQKKRPVSALSPTVKQRQEIPIASVVESGSQRPLSAFARMMAKRRELPMHEFSVSF